jgi:hypothetical protein
MRTTTSPRFKNLLGFALLVGLLTSISVTFTNCGGNDDDPDPKDTTTTTTSKFKAEYLKVDGKMYDAKTITNKQLGSDLQNNRFTTVWGGNVYPFLELTHERANDGAGDTLVPRTYVPSSKSTSEDFGYGVSFYYAEGSPPNYCQYQTRVEDWDKGNGTYELLKIDGKYVSEFSDVTLYCKNNGIYTDSIVVEGYVIWDEK